MADDGFGYTFPGLDLRHNVRDPQLLTGEIDDQLFVQKAQRGKIQPFGLIWKENPQKIGQKAVEQFFEQAIMQGSLRLTRFTHRYQSQSLAS
jgi:hypothetical protein